MCALDSLFFTLCGLSDSLKPSDTAAVSVCCQSLLPSGIPIAQYIGLSSCCPVLLVAHLQTPWFFTILLTLYCTLGSLYCVQGVHVYCGVACTVCRVYMCIAG